MVKFVEKKNLMVKITEELNEKYGQRTASLELKDSYFNMKEKIKDHMFLIEKAKEAMENLDIEPLIAPIRGGTDGAQLSYMGLPTPNICAGGLNFHGEYEYVSIQSMEKISELLVEIAVNIFK